MTEQAASNANHEPLETRVTTSFLSAVFIIVPLCVHNSFYDARRFKYYSFYALCILYFTYMLIITAAKILRREKLYWGWPRWKDYLFPAFAAIGIIGTVASGYGIEGLFAHDNREQGIITFIIYCILFCLIKRHGKITPQFKRFMLFSFVVVCILGILNQLHADPLGYVNILREDQRVRFTSTIGNQDFYGAYCVLLFPIPYYLFLHAGDKKKLCLYAVLSFVGFLGTMAARTEGALLGMISTLALIPLLCFDMRAVKRHIYSIGAILILLGLYSSAVTRLGGFSLSRLTNLLLQPVPYVVAMAFWAMAAFTASQTDERNAIRYRRIYGFTLFAAITVLLIAIVVINLFFADAVPAVVAKYAVASPEWGTDRGRIWERAIEIERSFTPIQQLIGGGSGCFARWDRLDALFEDAIMDTAHNEYLHYMLTHGILGLALYLGFMVSSIAVAIKQGGTEKRSIACGCIAYGIHGLISFAQVFTTPLFFLLMFLLNGKEPAVDIVESRDDKALSLMTAVAIAAFCFLIGYLRTNL